MLVFAFYSPFKMSRCHPCGMPSPGASLRHIPATAATRLSRSEQAVQFVNDVGFCFLFPIQNVEMPSLWDAIAGRVVKTYSSHSGYEIEPIGAGRTVRERCWFLLSIPHSKCRDAILVGCHRRARR